jgi:branched-chain amino acid transport system permease protein
MSGPRRITRGRPELYASYAADQAIWNTPAKRWSAAGLLTVAVALPFFLDGNLMGLAGRVVVFAIGGIGLNIISGYAGQISLGHALFLGMGAYTAAVLGGSPRGPVVGYELDMLIWLPAAGLVPAAFAWLIAPLAARVRGLYLGILTLGVLLIGEHVFREAEWMTGGIGVGRRAAAPVLLGFDFFAPREVLGRQVSDTGMLYLLSLAILVVLAILARNLARSRPGRAFSAVRDRDIAAEVMGVNLMRTKRLAFTISSFYAGIAGALLVAGRSISPQRFDLFLSIDFLAIVLIGGVATISGPIMGAAIIGFLVLEPRGLYGIWIRVRNYFKAWPFSY